MQLFWFSLIFFFAKITFPNFRYVFKFKNNKKKSISNFLINCNKDGVEFQIVRLFSVKKRCAFEKKNIFMFSLTKIDSSLKMYYSCWNIVLKIGFYFDQLGNLSVKRVKLFFSNLEVFSTKSCLIYLISFLSCRIDRGLHLLVKCCLWGRRFIFERKYELE